MKGFLVFSVLLAAFFQSGSSQNAPVIEDDDTVVCQVRVVDIQEDDHIDREEYRCVPDETTGLTYAVDLPEGVGEYEADLDAGSLYAAIPHGKISRTGNGDRMVVPEGSSVKLSKGKPEKKSPVRRRRSPKGRRLEQRKIGTSNVLVIRVIARDASTSLSRSEISNRVFGTDGDKVNLVSVYDSCSASKLKFVPATGNYIINGVGEVTIDANVDGMKNLDVDNLVVAAATKKFGNLEDNYDHVMLCLPKGTGSWVAYAYRNWYRSSYNDAWCGSPSAQVHEIGHNLGLKHSREGGVTYGDTSGLMGYSYSENEGPNMCFNGHKHWVLGWFNDRRTVVNPSTGAWTGKLATFVDYKSTSKDEEYVIIQVSGDLYLQYNRKKDFNSGTKEKGDQVTLTKASSANSESESLGGLASAGAKFTYNGVVIEVCDMYENAVPSYVHLSIYVQDAQSSRCGEEQDDPTSKPSNSPSAQPSGGPSRQPTHTPSKVPSPLPSTIPSKSPSGAPTNVPTVFLSSEPTATTLNPTTTKSVTPTQQLSQVPSSFPSNYPTKQVSKAPSSFPSTSPSFDDLGRKAGCESGEMRFQLSIMTDEYPQENDWELSSLDKSFVRTGGGYELSSTEYTEDLCIPDDGYMFIMNDKFGDGMCCDSGQGSYTVAINGVDITSGGQFQKNESTEIMTPCAGGKDRIMVEINTDYFGSETSWTLNTMAGAEVMSGSNYGAWETAKDTLCLDSSVCYSFTIMDHWGDGMCCSYGFGKYSIKFAGETYGESFIDGFQETVMVGTSCPALTASASHGGGRRHRHKDERAREERASSYAQAHQV